jgi:hypothetical protein
MPKTKPQTTATDRAREWLRRVLAGERAASAAAPPSKPASVGKAVER